MALWASCQGNLRQINRLKDVFRNFFVGSMLSDVRISDTAHLERVEPAPLDLRDANPRKRSNLRETKPKKRNQTDVALTLLLCESTIEPLQDFRLARIAPFLSCWEASILQDQVVS